MMMEVMVAVGGVAEGQRRARRERRWRLEDAGDALVAPFANVAAQACILGGVISSAASRVSLLLTDAPVKGHGLRRDHDGRPAEGGGTARRVHAPRLLASLTMGSDGASWQGAPERRDEHKQPKVQLASAAEAPVAAVTPGSIMRNMLAGICAGVAVESALYPIDTIKTRLQAARAGKPIQWGGLYKGLPANLIGAAPATAIFFGVYEPVKQYLLKAVPDNSFWAHFVAATSAGTAASLVRVPTEVVKQRIQTRQFSSALEAVTAISAKEGIRGLYAGYGSFLLRDLPFDAIEFVAYEQLKLAYARLVGGRELNSPETAAIGAAAGVCTAVLTTPLDVIKTRLMIQGTSGRYKGVVDCVRTILREEGAGTFFAGVGPRVLWIGIGGSIFFGVLEKAKSILNDDCGKEKSAA